jgi:hypothetical protein
MGRAEIGGCSSGDGFPQCLESWRSRASAEQSVLGPGLGEQFRMGRIRAQDIESGIGADVVDEADEEEEDEEVDVRAPRAPAGTWDASRTD